MHLIILISYYICAILTKIGHVSVGPDYFPKIMGIVNTSPESFYKKSIKLNTDEIQDTVLEMQYSGADIIDIGGMSTAPYLNTTIPIDVEIERLSKAISAIRQISKIPISIDTVRADVLRAMLKYEIDAVNDVTGLKYDKKMSQVVSESEIPVLIGAYKNSNSKENNLGSSKVLQRGDINDTINILDESIGIAKNHRIDKEKMIIDPSIGFFRKHGNNPFYSKIDGLEWYIRDLDILSNISLLRSFDIPICISVSRKSFIGSILDLGMDERLIPSLIAEIHCIQKGVSLIRTHNVKETTMAINVMDILQ
jgi:dihydropteroate synthase